MPNLLINVRIPSFQNYTLNDSDNINRMDISHQVKLYLGK
jgi:hypothetical protein